MSAQNLGFGRARLALGLVIMVSFSGCFSPWVSGQQNNRREQIKEVLQSEDRPRLVKQVAYERMITINRLENIALVSRLHGTGGKVNASQPREKMLDIMRRADASQPNTILDDANTAMVVAHVLVPPGARKGRLLDVNIKLSAHCEATSLRDGWLMEASLVEMSKLGGRVREGFEFATAEGQIVTLAEITGSQDPEDELAGIIVGGSRLLKSREQGIGVEAEFADAVTMAAILPAINTRFTAFNGRKQAGIATPLEDNYVQLDIPVRYQLDPFHFMNVVLNIGFNEKTVQREERIETLRKQLHEPTTVRDACWQLEAIGEASIPVLAEGLSHPSREIRFYVAHSMAYLNDRRAILPLSELCHQEPAFRAMCLNGLAVIDSFEAADELISLLHCANPEARYGAVRALRHRDPTNPLIMPKAIGEIGKLLEIASDGPPLVAISLSQTPEIVIFGENPQLFLPEADYITKRMMISNHGDGTVTISHFAAGQEDRTARVSSDLRSVLGAIAEVGGTYGNLVSFIREASQKGYLVEPIAINPVPTAGRVFDRTKDVLLEPGEQLFNEMNLGASDGSSGGKSVQSGVWYNPMTWWK